jgi:membrane-bound lytic murein transglycosylase D
LGKARTEFDRAVDLVLTSGLDLNRYPELEKDFQRKLDAIYRFELAALKQGDGFTERKPVPAAIEEVADAALETKTDPRFRAKLEREIEETISDVPLVINDYVATYINYFSTRGKAGLLNSWRRAGRYRGMIQRIFKEEGLPQDLIYMAQAESAFQPLALSRAGARGMWQFMAFTGKLYGLVKNWWIDERQDPEKATRAAARHLKDLYKRFGDWYLAMAAYNSGPLNVQRAVERTGYADFWELYKRHQLPRETKNYVPIIVAVTIMAKNPAAYGLTEAEPDVPMATETVRLNVPTDLRLIAETIDCSVELLQDLNPSLLRWVTPKTGEFDLRLPAGSRDRFLEQIALIPEDKRVWWRWHRVAEGDTLAAIAKNYKTTAAAIAEVNNLEGVAPETGSRLVIPIVPKNTSVEAAALGSKSRVVNLRYRVRKGDTLATVADRFGVEQDEVKRWNRLKTNILATGRWLVIQTAVREGQTVGGAARRPAKRASAKKKPAQSAKSTNTRRGPALAAARPASR